MAKRPLVNLHADRNQPLSHVVCPGQIVIRSRQEREATFYTFGGTLESEALSGETVFSLRSAAPVLELLPERETVANLLADETEVLFARAEAQQQLSSQQLLDRLVKAGPEAVYLAVLQSLLPKDEETAVSDHLPRRLYQNAHPRAELVRKGRTMAPDSARHRHSTTGDG